MPAAKASVLERDGLLGTSVDGVLCGLAKLFGWMLVQDDETAVGREVEQLRGGATALCVEFAAASVEYDLHGLALLTSVFVPAHIGHAPK
jgi:hypothetical protein